MQVKFLYDTFYNSQFKKYNFNFTHSYNRNIWFDMSFYIILPWMDKADLAFIILGGWDANCGKIHYVSHPTVLIDHREKVQLYFSFLKNLLTNIFRWGIYCYSQSCSNDHLYKTNNAESVQANSHTIIIV